MGVFFGLKAQTPSIEVPFYSAKLTLPSMPDMPLPMPEKLSEAFVNRAYAHFEACEYQPFLKKVGDYRRGMNLSDWHFYQIVVQSAAMLYPKQPRNFQVLVQWFVLRKSGIDARLFFSESTAWIHAPAPDIEFGFYTINQGDKRFVNLSAWQEGTPMSEYAVFTPAPPEDGAVMDFSMRIPQFPHMVTSETIERLIEFTHRGETLQVRVFLNRDYLRMMDDYPYYNQTHYFEQNLSAEAEASLFPALRKYMEGRDQRAQVEFLLSFTRTAFFYLDDHRRYGKEKPMGPEQTLYHSYSDCEDRSALFFYFARKLLKVPAIVLDFETHVGVALELPDKEGEYFLHKGRRFVYCEPTGPQDRLKIGEMWPDVRGQKARIISEYLPW